MFFVWQYLIHNCVNILISVSLKSCLCVKSMLDNVKLGWNRMTELWECPSLTDMYQLVQSSCRSWVDQGVVLLERVEALSIHLKITFCYLNSFFLTWVALTTESFFFYTKVHPLQSMRTNQGRGWLLNDDGGVTCVIERVGGSRKQMLLWSDIFTHFSYHCVSVNFQLGSPLKLNTFKKAQAETQV